MEDEDPSGSVMGQCEMYERNRRLIHAFTLCNSQQQAAVRKCPFPLPAAFSQSRDHGDEGLIEKPEAPSHPARAPPPPPSSSPSPSHLAPSVILILLFSFSPRSS
eukprot:764999-Hanusia_phi.AAC.2